MVWASVAMDVSWSATDVALLVGAVAGGVCMFMGLVVIQATLAFWTTETLEIMNTVTYGGVETTQYPIAIYRPWFQRLFTFGVPLACVSYFPAAGDHRQARPARFAPVVPVHGADDRRGVPDRHASAVEVRRASLLVHGELRQTDITSWLVAR